MARALRNKVLTAGGGLAVVLVGLLVWAGCGAGIFNPAFLNTFVGGQFPVTPGPVADFIMVRGLNQTGLSVEFIVTIEREELILDEFGNPIVNDQNEFVTQSARETVELLTGETGTATDLGVLFPCDRSPVTVVGLGENLLPTDSAAFVGGAGAGGAAGFGVSASGLNPLTLEAGNFACGDTIIFQAFTSVGQPGGVALRAFRLPGNQQPSIFSGPDTFVNYQNLLQSQIPEED